MNVLYPHSILPRWVVMWGISVMIYAVLKGLALGASRSRGHRGWRVWAFLLAWPGMDADTFLSAPVVAVQKPAHGEWLFAAGKLLLGVLLIDQAAWVAGGFGPYAVGWVGMVGIVFALHFGLFHLLSCLWRECGVEAVPLMNWPIVSVSLTEFWGRRWNLAFRDLTHRFLFQPLRHRVGPSGALLLGFLASGIVHDLVISVPAGGGYGGPTLFFVLQGLAIACERSPQGQRIGLGRGIVGRAFCLMVLLAPCCWLFHRPFVCNVIVPFLQAIRGVS